MKRAIILILLFILIVCNSCEWIKDNDEEEAKTEGYVTDIITHEKLANVKVYLLEWYESWFYTGSYWSMNIDSALTEPNGHFLINYHPTDKYKYSLTTSKDGYFNDGNLMGTHSAMNDVTINIFPHGYVKTHIANHIESSRWIDIYFAPFLGSTEVWRDGFINTGIFCRAFADTTIITTTIGGVTNNLKILVNRTDNTSDATLEKDTSFISLRQDTVYLDITLK